MRLGLVIYGSLSVVSGGYLYDRKLVEHLLRQGNQVEIISLPWRSYAWRLADNFSPRLARRLKQGTFDILLQDELNHASLFWINQRLQAHRRGGEIRRPYPLVSIVHHLRSSELRPSWHNRLYRLVEASYLKSVDGFIFNSQTTQKAARAAGAAVPEGGLAGQSATGYGSAATGPIDPGYKPSIVAYPAADHLNPQISAEEIAARAVIPGPLRLLFVGNLIPRKGLHTLLDALARLPQDACQLTVIGNMAADPAYTAAIRRQIEYQQLVGCVKLCGILGEDDLRLQMKSHHLVVVPSSYEGFGIIYMEGMGFGLPAIATTAGAATEIIHNGQDGFLAPPGDAITLAQVLTELAQDRQRLCQTSLAARQRYLSHPGWEQTTTNIEEFLQSLLGKKR